jgi:5-(carboxyamino)imidazole ribonucleotide mutase
MAQKVLIVMGSNSDFDTLEPAWKILDEFGIEHQVRVASAHRTPDVVHELITGARAAGYSVIIAAAGMAAHLAGVSAALTTLPVVAVPIPSGSLSGVDALLASVQMPPGVPLAAVGIGGARNAGLYAAQIIGSTDATIADKLAAYRKSMHDKVTKADAAVRAKLGQS